jgi:hypothetical protein
MALPSKGCSAKLDGMKIFVVTCSTGSYDDRNQWVVKGFTQEARARSFANECMADGDDLRRKHSVIWSEFLRASRKIRTDVQRENQDEELKELYANLAASLKQLNNERDPKLLEQLRDTASSTYLSYNVEELDVD